MVLLRSSWAAYSRCVASKDALPAALDAGEAALPLSSASTHALLQEADAMHQTVDRLDMVARASK